MKSNVYFFPLPFLHKSVAFDQISLRLGEYNFDSTNEPEKHIDRKVDVRQSLIHPKYDSVTFEYDLALLKFSEPVTFSPTVIPICISEDDDQLVGENGWIAGWGRLYEGTYLHTFKNLSDRKLWCKVFKNVI